MSLKLLHKLAVVGGNWLKMTKKPATCEFPLEVEHGFGTDGDITKRRCRSSAYDASLQMHAISRPAAKRRGSAFVFELAGLCRLTQFFLVPKRSTAHGRSTVIPHKGKKSCLTKTGSSLQSLQLRLQAAWKTTQSAHWLVPAQAAWLVKLLATTTVLKARSQAALSAHWLTTSNTAFTSARRRALDTIDRLWSVPPKAVFLLKDPAHV